VPSAFIFIYVLHPINLLEEILSASATDTPPQDSLETAPQSTSYPARFSQLDRVRDFVGQVADAGGLNPEAIYQVQLAVDEAFTNIVEHAYGGECDKEIVCTCQILANGLSITLRDCGQTFDPTRVPEPDLEADLEERQIGGLGLFFIRQLMDEVEFAFASETETGQECNIIKMIKYKEEKS
jgi:anti-sigma regulatory factor (Ser/Thr protein kinase)